MLSRLIALDEGALICDLAEVYGVFDYREHSAFFISTLAAGLDDNSRSKAALSGIGLPLDRYILAYCADKLSAIAWLMSEDGAKGRNRPRSLIEILRGENGEKRESDVMAFDSVEEFEAFMKDFEVRRNGEQ